MQRRKRPWRAEAGEAWSVLKKTAQDWNDHNGFTQAAAIAYYTAFAVAPLLVITIAIAGLGFGERAARGEIAGQLAGLIGATAAQAIEAMMASARKPATGFLANVFGIGALLVGASAVFSQLHQSLNLIWQVETAKTQGVWRFLRSRLLSFGVVLGVGFVLLVSMSLSAAIAAAGTKLQHVLPGAEALLHATSSVLSLGIRRARGPVRS